MTTLMFRRFNLIWPTVKDVRDVVKHVLSSYHIEGECIDDAGLVITEYLTNLMRHATGQDELITLIFSQQNQYIHLELLDNTPYFAEFQSDSLAENIEDGALRQGGMGLALIKHYFPDYRYYKKDSVNCFSIRFVQGALKPQLVVVAPNDSETKAIKNALSDQYQVIGFTDEQQALDHLLLNDVEFLLLDMQLNESTAMDLMQKLQNRRGSLQTAVIVISDNKDWQTRQSACAMGIDDYLLKPVDLEQLQFVLKRVNVRNKQRQTAMTNELSGSNMAQIGDSQAINQQLFLHKFGSVQQADSGDFYLFKQQADKQFLLFADVMGHGLKAGIEAQKIKGFIHGCLQSPLSSIEQLINLLSQSMHAEQLTNNSIVTVLGLEISGQNIKWLSAGHPLPILIDQDGLITPLQGCQPLIGLSLEHKYHTQQISLSKHEYLLLYSDGLVENREKHSDLEQLLPALLPSKDLTGLDWATALWQKSLPLLTQDVDDSSLLIIN